MLKKLIAVSFLLLPSTVLAWEHPLNPDRFPSVGLSYEGATMEGEIKTQGVGQDTEIRTGLLLLDARLPMSNSFTLELGIGSSAMELEAKESPFFFAGENKTTGAFTRIGARYYFNH